MNSGPPGPAVLAVPLGEADNSPTAQTEFASCYAVKIGKTGAEHESDSAGQAEVLQNAELDGGCGRVGGLIGSNGPNSNQLPYQRALRHGSTSLR